MAIAGAYRELLARRSIDFINCDAGRAQIFNQARLLQVTALEQAQKPACMLDLALPT